MRLGDNKIVQFGSKILCYPIDMVIKHVTCIMYTSCVSVFCILTCIMYIACLLTVNGMSDNAGINGDSNHATEPSSGYISSQEDVPESDHLPSLDLENRLLKNEVTQLSQEMTSVIHRAKEAQDG